MKPSHVQNNRCILALGGTGMLRPAVHELLNRDYTVLAVSRHPERGAPAEVSAGRYLPVPGDWNRPEALTEQVLQTLYSQGGVPADLQGAIVWVHAPYRRTILDQLEHVLTPEATVLQLWGSAAHHPRRVMDAENHVPRPWKTRHLLLGYSESRGCPRWLTDEEISQATIRTWDDDAEQARDYTAGRIDPWEQRP